MLVGVAHGEVGHNAALATAQYVPVAGQQISPQPHCDMLLRVCLSQDVWLLVAAFQTAQGP